MPATLSLNEFLHSASLLIHAYPTSRITTKYSLPRPPKSADSKPSQKETTATTNGAAAASSTTTGKERREPSATLTVKVYHPSSGLCLKYSTDKAQEVGRLITSLGRLARGETIELPATTTATGNVAGREGEGAPDEMEVDSGPQVVVKEGDATVVGKPSGGQTAQQQQQQQQQQGQGGGGGKKKKGKGKR